MLKLILIVLVLHGHGPVTACSRQPVASADAILLAAPTANGRRLRYTRTDSHQREHWQRPGINVTVQLPTLQGPVCVTARGHHHATVRLRLPVRNY